MSLESDLYTAITTVSGFAALVGSRVYPNRLPDEPTLPAVVYRRITTTSELASGHVPLQRVRFQVDVWGSTYASVVAVGNVLAGLNMTSPTGIHAVIPEDEDDTYDPDAHLHRRRLDFYVWKVL